MERTLQATSIPHGKGLEVQRRGGRIYALHDDGWCLTGRFKGVQIGDQVVRHVSDSYVIVCQKLSRARVVVVLFIDNGAESRARHQ